MAKKKLRNACIITCKTLLSNCNIAFCLIQSNRLPPIYLSSSKNKYFLAHFYETIFFSGNRKYIVSPRNCFQLQPMLYVYCIQKKRKMFRKKYLKKYAIIFLSPSFIRIYVCFPTMFVYTQYVFNIYTIIRRT